MEKRRGRPVDAHDADAKDQIHVTNHDLGRLARVQADLFRRVAEGTWGVEDVLEELRIMRSKLKKTDLDLYAARCAWRQLKDDPFNHALAACDLYEATRDEYFLEAAAVGLGFSGDDRLQILIRLYDLGVLQATTLRELEGPRAGGLAADYVRVMMASGNGDRLPAYVQALQPRWKAEAYVAQTIEDPPFGRLDAAQDLLCSYRADEVSAHIIRIVRMLGKAGLIEQGQQFLNLLPEGGKDRAYGEVILDISLGLRVLELAAKTAQQGLHRLVQDSLAANAAALIFEAFGDEEMYTEVLAALQPLDREGIETTRRDELRVCLVRGLALQGKIVEARKMARRLVEPEMVVKAYCAIYKARHPLSAAPKAE